MLLRSILCWWSSTNIYVRCKPLVSCKQVAIFLFSLLQFYPLQCLKWCLHDFQFLCKLRCCNWRHYLVANSNLAAPARVLPLGHVVFCFWPGCNCVIYGVAIGHTPLVQMVPSPAPVCFPTVGHLTFLLLFAVFPGCNYVTSSVANGMWNTNIFVFQKQQLTIFITLKWCNNL